MHRGGALPAGIGVRKGRSDPAAIADRSLRIALRLAGRERSVRELQDDTGLAQSLVSYHLAGLRAAGLMTACPQGRSNRYQLCCADLDELVRGLARLAATARAGQ